MSTTTVTRRNTRRFLIGALVVAALAFIGIAASGINENLVYYWTPSDLQLAGKKAYGATIRLGGQVAPGTVRGVGGVSGLEFDVTDKKSIVHVKSNGVPPQMFREGIGVVVEGTMTRAGYFESERLMVSHNNEYKTPQPGEAINAKELIKTTEGVQ